MNGYIVAIIAVLLALAGISIIAEALDRHYEEDEDFYL